MKKNKSHKIYGRIIESSYNLNLIEKNGSNHNNELSAVVSLCPSVYMYILICSKIWKLLTPLAEMQWSLKIKC